MDEKVEKNIPKIVDDFIEDGHWWIKRITAQRESLVYTMDSCKEDELMFRFLGDEILKIKEIISNMEKIKHTREVCYEHIKLYKAMTKKD